MLHKRKKAQVHSVSTIESKRHYGHPSMHGLAIFAFIAVVILGSYYITIQNKPESPIKNITKNGSSSLTKSKATGIIEEISGQYILVRLPSGAIRVAAFDSDTEISTPSGSQKLGDITSGSQVVLFTKKVAGQDIATRVIVQ